MNSEIPDISRNNPLHSIQLEHYLSQSTQKLDITHIYTVKQNIVVLPIIGLYTVLLIL